MELSPGKTVGLHLIASPAAVDVDTRTEHADLNKYVAITLANRRLFSLYSTNLCISELPKRRWSAPIRAGPRRRFCRRI
jgi:hypothetical protein